MGASWAFALILTALFAAPSRAQSISSINYTVTLEPRVDRTQLSVRVKLEGDWPSEVPIRPPQNCYGSLDMSAFITRPVQLHGDTLPVLPEGGGWSLRTLDGGTTISYEAFYPPEAMKGAFAPNTSGSHFHAAGCQWMIVAGKPDATRSYSVEIPHAPAGWEVYSTWGRRGVRGYIEGSYDDVATTAIGGQAGTFASFEVRSRPVDVYVADGFAIASRRIASMVAEIVRYQRDLMGVYDFPFYFVAVRPGRNVIAGTSVDHMFVAFVKPDATAFEIAKVVSHEMFHVFLPHTLQVVSPDDDSYARFLWFHEGVVEYMAREILVDLRMISPAQAVEALNGDLRALADNPHRAWPYRRLRQAVETNGYSQSLMKFNYYRGALLAARWDYRLKKRGYTGLSQLLKLMIQEARAGDGLMEEDRFFEIGAEHGLDIRHDFERFILQGEQIVPPAAYAGSTYEMRRIQVPRFDLGFDLSASWQKDALTGVRSDGPAYRAGLRNGMALVRTKNTTRDSNTWREGAPAVIVVRDGDGEERSIEYLPYAGTHAVDQYVRNEGQDRDSIRGR